MKPCSFSSCNTKPLFDCQARIIMETCSVNTETDVYIEKYIKYVGYIFTTKIVSQNPHSKLKAKFH